MRGGGGGDNGRERGDEWEWMHLIFGDSMLEFT